jgi:hypothetical protein
MEQIFIIRNLTNDILLVHKKYDSLIDKIKISTPKYKFDKINVDDYDLVIFDSEKAAFAFIEENKYKPFITYTGFVKIEMYHKL